MPHCNLRYFKANFLLSQVVIAQWLARWLATEEVPGSNPGKGDNLLLSGHKGNLINLNLNTIIEWVYELTGLVQHEENVICNM